jgi:hypothetical protein
MLFNLYGNGALKEIEERDSDDLYGFEIGLALSLKKKNMGSICDSLVHGSSLNRCVAVSTEMGRDGDRDNP